jgi:hypothetical protein
MEKTELNIGKILGSKMALHNIGKKAYKEIEVTLKEMQKPTLFVINLRETDPIDYEFVNVAFNEIFKKYLSDPNLFLAFKSGEWEMEELFTGLTKIMNLKKEGDESDKELLMKNNISLIVINDKDETIYVTSLSGTHMAILKDIESTAGTTSGQIQSKFNLNAEDTSHILTNLLKYKFIYHLSGPIYHSVNKLI